MPSPGVRKIAIECEADLLNQAVDGVVQALQRLLTCRGTAECPVELAQVLGLDHQMKLAKLARSQPERTAGQPMATNHPALRKMAEEPLEVLDEGEIRRAGLQVEPRVINEHRCLLRFRRAYSGKANGVSAFSAPLAAAGGALGTQTLNRPKTDAAIGTVLKARRLTIVMGCLLLIISIYADPRTMR